MFNQIKNELLLKCKIIRILILNIVKKIKYCKKTFTFQEVFSCFWFICDQFSYCIDFINMIK